MKRKAAVGLDQWKIELRWENIKVWLVRSLWFSTPMDPWMERPKFLKSQVAVKNNKLSQ